MPSDACAWRGVEKVDVCVMCQDVVVTGELVAPTAVTAN
jgi:hypothetical protein